MVMAMVYIMQRELNKVEGTETETETNRKEWWSGEWCGGEWKKSTINL